MIICIILNDSSIHIIDVLKQKELRNLEGRSIIADFIAKDKNNNIYNIEIQRKKSQAPVERVRYYNSIADMNISDTGMDFKEFPNVYTIFIVEDDIFGYGLPIYHVDRVIRKTGNKMNEGSHIIYVNGQYKGDTPIGNLIHDFRCEDYREMKNEVLKEKVKYYKEGDGKIKMCDIWKQIKED